MKVIEAESLGLDTNRSFITELEGYRKQLAKPYLKNNDLKIKQSIELDNKRYKPIILGKNGNTIKRIRECSQKDIKSIINNNIHLYLQIDTKNAK